MRKKVGSQDGPRGGQAVSDGNGVGRGRMGRRREVQAWSRAENGREKAGEDGGEEGEEGPEEGEIGQAPDTRERGSGVGRGRGRGRANRGSGGQGEEVVEETASHGSMTGRGVGAKGKEAETTDGGAVGEQGWGNVGSNKAMEGRGEGRESRREARELGKVEHRANGVGGSEEATTHGGQGETLERREEQASHGESPTPSSVKRDIGRGEGEGRGWPTAEAGKKGVGWAGSRRQKGRNTRYTKGGDMRDDRDVSEGGGGRRRVRGPNEDRAGFSGVESLPRSEAEGVEGVGERREGCGGEVGEMDSGVISMVVRDEADAVDGDA